MGSRRWRFNPFTGQVSGATQTEYHVISALSAVAITAGIELYEGPLKASTPNVTIKHVTNSDPESPTYGTTFTEVDRSVSPSTSQYRVDYDSLDSASLLPVEGYYTTGLVEFNGADIGKMVEVTYVGTGSLVLDPLIELFGVGSIIWHTTHLTGADSLTTMRSKGWALCDGTTAASQGVLNAVITGTLPDLVTDGHFIRASGTSGTLQDSQVVAHKHTLTDPGHTHTIQTRVNNLAGVIVAAAVGPGDLVGPISTNTTGISLDDAISLGGTGDPAVDTGDETRPINMSALPLMRVR